VFGNRTRSGQVTGNTTLANGHNCTINSQVYNGTSLFYSEGCSLSNCTSAGGGGSGSTTEPTVPTNIISPAVKPNNSSNSIALGAGVGGAALVGLAGVLGFIFLRKMPSTNKTSDTDFFNEQSGTNDIFVPATVSKSNKLFE
jgi:hypothetical protein